MAGTVAVSSDILYPKAGVFGEQNTREVTLLCTADDSDASYPDTNIVYLSGYEHGPLSGWGLWMVETDPGTTGPTADTDLYLKTANGTDILGGNGENAIDNATNNLIYPPVSPFMIGGTLTQDIDNNAVNEAVVTIKYYLVR
jgi:hypothetical protein